MYDGLKTFPITIRNNMCKHLTLSIHNSKNRSLPSYTKVSLASNSTGFEISLIEFNLARERRVPFDVFSLSLSRSMQNPVRIIHTHESEFFNFRCIKIHGNIFHKPTKITLQNARKMTIPD